MILLHIFSEYYVCRAKNYLLAILTTVINSIPDTSAHDTLLIQRDGSVILNNPLLKKEVENDCQQNIPDKTIIFTNFEIKKHKNNKITSSLY
jgi:hypothetical protein